jgi:hypothetical protein
MVPADQLGPLDVSIELPDDFGSLEMWDLLSRIIRDQ